MMVKVLTSDMSSLQYILTFCYLLLFFSVFLFLFFFFFFFFPSHIIWTVMEYSFYLVNECFFFSRGELPLKTEGINLNVEVWNTVVQALVFILASALQLCLSFYCVLWMTVPKALMVHCCCYGSGGCWWQAFCVQFSVVLAMLYLICFQNLRTFRDRAVPVFHFS